MSIPVRYFTILNLCILITIVYLNFELKNNFLEITLSNKILNTRLRYEEQMLSTLRAEFVYISSPEYLNNLSNKYLHLSNIKSNQIVADLDQAIALIKKGEK